MKKDKGCKSKATLKTGDVFTINAGDVITILDVTKDKWFGSKNAWIVRIIRK